MIDKFQEAVMLSVKPKWTALIRDGKKTIEVRKTFPGMVCLPFRVYLYETKGFERVGNDNLSCVVGGNGLGAVIGEFDCDEIYDAYEMEDGYRCEFSLTDACLTEEELVDYLAGGEGYGWHISNLKLYQDPVPLSAFGMKRPPQSWRYVAKKDVPADG